MALTPEDVVNKEFTSPKGFGRSGYDMVQVDDFLDEIVEELKRLNSENESLNTRLKDCESGKGLTRGSSTVKPAPVAPAPAPAAKQESPAAAKVDDECARKLEAATNDKQRLEGDLKAARDRVAQLESELARAREASAKAAAAPAPTQTPAGTEDAAGVIALAQRLHDEHVHEGETKRDKLIADAQAHHDKVVGEATAKRDSLIQAGQQRHDELIRAAHTERDQLSGQIEYLRNYHDSYRSHLREYIGSQLKGLEHSPLDEFNDPRKAAVKTN